jgi:NhaA family Na+:H+ antiporter
MENSSPTHNAPPEDPIDRVIAPIARFLHVEAAGGAVLLVATAIALTLANSSTFGESYLAIWSTPVEFGFGTFKLSYPLTHWINDGLMALFFFVIGLEVKREIVLGELSDMQKAALPIAAAIGGMVIPAAVYLLFQAGQSAESGWGITMATDIAFVVGCMAVLGTRMPSGLRILMLSLAIGDDIGAIMVIAIVYTETIHLGALALGCAGIGLVIVLGRLGVQRFGVYILIGCFVWLAFHESGVHATIAGVVLGMITPARPRIPSEGVGRILARANEIFDGDRFEEAGYRGKTVRHFQQLARETVSPVEYLEQLLHPWASFVIIPLFALANAGVVFSLSDLGDPVAIAVALGLSVGKPLGIVLFCFIAVKIGVAALPEGVTWAILCSASFLAGIGFTMSLFISGLALEGLDLEAAKVGILAGSLIAAIIGMGLLFALLPKAPDPVSDSPT